MKQYTTIKIGYSAGINGVNDNIFTTIFINGKNHGSFSHHGMYGSEERINAVMNAKGYKEFYTPSYYGQMTRADKSKWIMSEKEAIGFINGGLIHE